MEYLKVIVPGRNSQDVDVLINKKQRGNTGEVLTMRGGYVLVSVNLPDAEEKVVDLCDTTAALPCVTEISV